jgi:hypothetical protein
MCPDPPTGSSSAQYTFGDNTNIRADVFGGNKYETNVYLLRAATGQVDWSTYRDKKRAPYRFLDSYDLLDASIYAGRDADISRLEGEVLANRLVVLQGPVGVGKTSLLQAALTPRLMNSGYLVLSAQEYADPVAALIWGLAQTRDRLQIDLAEAKDLMGLVRTVQASLERPVLLIFEHFESFFSDPCSSSASRESLRAQLKAFREATFSYPACLVLSIRQQSQGQLAYFQPAVPDIFHHVVALDLLLPVQARQSILAPLTGLDPPMVFDPKFLDRRLLPDLATAGRDDNAIDPPHLQILCSILYREARARDQNLIDADLYQSLGGKRGTLGNYVDSTLSEEFPDTARYQLARRLLKAMASPGGEPVSLSLTEASQEAGQPPDAVLGVLEILVRRSLVFARAEQTYGLAHPIMNETVLGWFDRKEAEVRCAQDSLDHAWYDWLAWDRLEQSGVGGSDKVETDRAMEPGEHRSPSLLSSGQLHEIALRRGSLKIEPGQHALLLRSAAVVTADTAPWVEFLASDPAATALVSELQAGGAPARAEQPAGQFARVLGIVSDAETGNALGRGMTDGRPADVRHAAALALASLGSDAVAQALWPRKPVRRTLGQRWRVAQGLAWMRAAGRRLPELPSLWLRIAVSIGDRLTRFRTDWPRIAVEALGAALGAAAAYVLRVAIMEFFTLLGGVQYVSVLTLAVAIASSINFAGLGFVVGALTVLVTHLVAPEPRAGETQRPGWQRLVGVTCGFVLGLAVGLPAEFAILHTRLVETPSLLGRYVIGGSIMGLGMAIGLVIEERRGHRLAIAGATCGGALAGLAIGELDWIGLKVGLPAFTSAGSLLFTLLQYALVGALLGAGLVGGWLQGRRIWERWQKEAGVLFG